MSGATTFSFGRSADKGRRQTDLASLDASLQRSVDPVASGTNLVGRIRLNPLIPALGVILGVILAGWLWVGIDAIVGHVRQGRAIDSGLVFAALLMPALFGLFHGLFYYVGYRLFVRDRIELIAFLTGALASVDQAGIAPDPTR
jgi:hypothetical protein